MSDADEALQSLKEIFNCDVDIDTGSASAAGDASSKVERFLLYTAVRALTSSGSSGLKGVLDNSELGPWFRGKTDKMKIVYEESSRDLRIKWDGKTLIMTWGERAKSVDDNYIFYTYSYFRNAHRVEEKAKKFKEETIPEARDKIARTFGPGKGFEIDVDWDSFSALEEPDEATSRLHDWNGYYTTQPLCRAVYDIATYEEDPIVDAICDGLKTVTFVCEPGTDPDKKGYEVDKKGNVKIKMCFEISGSTGIFDSDEMKAILMAAGLKNKPEYKMYLLSSVATSYRVRAWGWLDELEELVGDEGMGLFYKSDADDTKAADAMAGKEGRTIKLFGNLTKVNRRGRKQKRSMLLTTTRFYTCEVAKAKVKDKNFKGHTLSDLVCIDLYPMGKMPGTKPLGLSIWTNEVEEKKPGFFGKLKVKIPGVKLPGIPLPDMPKVDLPNVDLPNVDLPNVDLPDMPDMPKFPSLPSFDLSMPELFKRHKEPKPKRYHPATKGVNRSFEFVAVDLGTKEGNALIEEVAWCVYAAWAANTRRTNYQPFYLKEKKVFESGEQIEDCRPKIENEEKKD